MSDFARTVSVNKRLERLENALAELWKVVNRELGGTRDVIDNLVAITNAVTSVVGLDEVQKQLSDDAKARLDSEVAAIAERVSNGQLVVAETVSLQSIIGYKEVDGAGNARGPGKFHKSVVTLQPETQQALVGAKVGAEFPLGNGGKLVLEDIWDIAAPVVQEPPAAAPVETAPVAPAAAEVIQFPAPTPVEG